MKAEKFFWTHAFDGETFFLKRFTDQDSAWMFYESMKSIGVEQCKRFGLTHEAETEKRMTSVILEMGKKFQMWD